jgi:hypothetical protein
MALHMDYNVLICESEEFNAQPFIHVDSCNIPNGSFHLGEVHLGIGC